MKMNTKTLKALKSSIAHWKRNKAGKDDGIDSSECSLCDIFWNDIEEHCSGCPIKNETKQDNCYGSPYYEARHAYRIYGPTSAEFKYTAQKEVDFLKGLLP